MTKHPVDFSIVTEIGGTQVTTEQIARLAQRYYWAGEYCRGRDILDVACGAGQGLGDLSSLARSLRAGDITPSLVAQARSHYGSRIDIAEMDATRIAMFSAVPFISTSDGARVRPSQTKASQTAVSQKLATKLLEYDAWLSWPM